MQLDARVPVILHSEINRLGGTLFLQRSGWNGLAFQGKRLKRNGKTPRGTLGTLGTVFKSPIHGKRVFHMGVSICVPTVPHTLNNNNNLLKILYNKGVKAGTVGGTVAPDSVPHRSAIAASVPA